MNEILSSKIWVSLKNKIQMKIIFLIINRINLLLLIYSIYKKIAIILFIKYFLTFSKLKKYI